MTALEKALADLVEEPRRKQRAIYAKQLREHLEETWQALRQVVDRQALLVKALQENGVEMIQHGDDILITEEMLAHK